MNDSCRSLRKTTLAIAASIVVGIAPSGQAVAAACIWNPATGNWNVAANWSCGIVPSGPGSDSATIAGGKTVTVDDPRSIFTLNNAGAINIDQFLLTLQGGGSTVNTGTINVGSAITAALQMSHAINNTGGVIHIANGSVLNQFTGAITGGTINTSGTGALVAFNNANNFLSGVTLNGRLDMASGLGIQRVVGGLTLGGPGVVDINAGSLLTFEGTQTIGGSGAFNFGNAAGNRIQLEGAGTTTLDAGVTIRGQNGTIGSAQSFIGGVHNLVNNGIVSADVAAGQINLINAGGGGITNNNLLEARNGGTLNIQSVGVVQGGAGQINALNGSTVRQNSATVTGGTLGSGGSGTFVATNSASNFLNGVTLNGVLDMATAVGIERISGGMVLNGTIHIGNASLLAPQGNQTLSGTGSIVFADGNAGNRLNVEAGNLVIGSGVTVRGERGIIGQQAFIGGASTLTNNGSIQADVAGGAITVAVNGLTTNNGTLAALNGGLLNLNSAVQGSLGSQILAGAGSVVAQNGVTISGVVNTTGSGSFRPSNSGSNVLDGVSFSGKLDLASALGIERVVNGLAFNGATVNIGSGSVFAPQGNQTISGTGAIVFADGNASNRLNVEAGNLVIGSGVTVRGERGSIGQQAFVGGASTLTNNGVIQADVAGGAINLAVNGLTTNNGTLAALNGATLNLNSAVTGNTGSQILAGAGSVVAQNGVTLSGDMNLTGPGSFRASNSGSNFLSGVTVSGVLDLASALGIERVSGGLTLNGATVNIGSGSVFAPQGNQTIGGTGSIIFADANAGNRLNVEAGNLVLGSGVTVRGGNGSIGSQIFVGGAATLTNQGLISADVAGRSITVGVNGAVINQSTMEARNGGQLTLNAGGGYDNSAGIVFADNGSTVLINGATLTGGALNSSGSGVLRASNNINNVLNGVTLNGVLDLASAQGIARTSAGGMTVNGRIDIGAGSTFAPQGNQTIGGSGTIVFADSNVSNRLNVEAGNLIIGSGVTVRGQTGFIGQQAFVGGAATLTNNGTINADALGTITVNINGSLTNNGTMRAQNGTLTIQDALAGTGTLQVDTAGVMNLANLANSQGKLVMGAAGSTLNIGTQNLTIHSDYTSVVAGSGDAFNRRAGVSGAGQILAGGDAAQTITGANVSNGNTANATLTINNVRVGSTTFDYQVANTGSTGPTLRGAIQTAVNGANLSDARLSGTGVTAANYAAGAPGGNSGNLGVTFTAAAAGALAPLTGQVLNLRSNFDNIADQKLNIVLGAGAAAYNAAVGSTSPSPVQVANQRVGGSNVASLAVSNIAAAGAFSEDLNASFDANGGAATNNGGGVVGLLAGANNGTAMKVGVDTSTAGAKTGNVTLNYQSTGAVAGVSNGLGVIGAGSQVITVNGNVYQAAGGAIQTAALNFGTVQVGQVVTQNLVIANTATGPAGFVEDLNASFGASSGTGAGLISGSGSLTGIVAGTSSTAANGVMTVSVDTSAANLVNGNIAVNYFTAGAVGGVSNGLGTALVGSQAYGVAGTIQAQANVVNQASPLVNNPVINLGAARVGDASPTANVSVTNVATVAPQAALNASIGSNGAPVTATGSFNLLAPGSTNAAALQVGLATAVAGNYTGGNAGSATIAFVSDASNVGNCAPNCQLTLASQQVSVAGKVYAPAIGQLATTTLDFGVVRVGDTVSAKNIVVNNAAAATALNDTLRADLSGVGGPFTGGAGSASGIGAQASGNIAVGLNTAAAGIFAQAGSVAFLSQNPDMVDIAAGANGNVQVMAQINNLANADFDFLSGLGVLTQTGTSYLLDLGTILLGQSMLTSLRLDNDVSGPADILSGLFDLLTNADDFSYTGWGPVNGLAAGQATGNLDIGFLASTVGLFEDVIGFSGVGTNASDPTGLAQSRQLVIRANVVDAGGGNVPEPGTLALLVMAAASAFVSRRRRKGAH